LLHLKFAFLLLVKVISIYLFRSSCHKKALIEGFEGFI